MTIHSVSKQEGLAVPRPTSKPVGSQSHGSNASPDQQTLQNNPVGASAPKPFHSSYQHERNKRKMSDEASLSAPRSSPWQPVLRIILRFVSVPRCIMACTPRMFICFFFQFERRKRRRRTGRREEEG
ncbi:unnamed protein product [Arctogadus glacialis]